MRRFDRIWRRHAALRLLVVLLGLLALAVMPVRALSVNAAHHAAPIPVGTMAAMEDQDCPLHQAAQQAASHQDHGKAMPDNAGKGAGPCCVAWCVAAALPGSPLPVLFPPPARLSPPAALADHDGRHPAPPLRPPRG
ncbi:MULTISPECIES: hypothetical protein [unclassified Azospirillum]|uniref:hypothetical protein n=1 Tax=unclassified Azospirillum TaxID=2630922 RepID=UPI000B750CA1|nr:MULTISPECIES: hypothetical protein [unclassified Azospirillum]SNS47849.1 hypothetical protein SAMN05880556_105152 [Azospirillum sp. RU38E]SNS67007.1 hypothetical protein SAMN05880591_105152 [Azospirillum sp. RU37A]